MTLPLEGIHKCLMVIVSLPTFPLCCFHVGIIILYPAWTKMRITFDVRPLMTLHNFVCSLASLYTFIGVLYCFLFMESTFKLGPDQCQLPYFRVYLITKMLELFDTVIMILRHRRQQINFLHVYHHTTMVLITDAGYHFFPWPTMSVYVAINALVHFITYLFYGLSTFFPNTLLPWRKTNTKMEIAEFLVLNVIASFAYLNNELCIYSVLYGITILSLNIYYLSLSQQNLQK